MPADGIDLVDEHDRRSRRLCLREQVPDPARADADEQLDELGARDAEERDVSLTGDGPGEERLARAGRADQQDAARQPGAEALVAVGRLQEVDDFGELGLGLVLAGHVGEGDLRALGVVEASPAAAKPEDPRLAALHLATHVDDHADDQRDRQDPKDEVEQERAPAGVLGDDRDAM